jgi:TatD DNase family protein
VSEQLNWTDNHCHLPDDAEAAAAAVVAAHEVGVVRMIDVGTDLDRSLAAIAHAEQFESVWATVGLHPHDASNGLSGLAELLDHPRVVAVGECGLDYHYDYSPREVQRASFADQIALAQASGLPLVIHSRSAWDDTFAVLRSEGVPEQTVFHCFTGGAREAELALDLGTTLSFSGIVTFKSAAELREAALICPIECLMVETDSPYLTPEPHRGQPNRPALVTLVGACIAKVKSLDLAHVAAATSRNASSFYRI